jgi:hypothetical protein
MSDDLIRPYGGRLVNLLVGTERAQELLKRTEVAGFSNGA